MITTATRVFARSATPLLLASILVFFLPGEAAACSCAPVTTAEVVASADLVFVGEEVGRIETRQEWPAIAVTFAVAEAYKGSVGSEITVWTGSGGGDCGVGPTAGLVGIAAYADGDRATINSCGSLHDAAAIAAVLDPVEIIEASPPSSVSGGASGAPWPLIGIAGAAGIAMVAVFLVRRRRADWQAGWTSGA